MTSPAGEERRLAIAMRVLALATLMCLAVSWRLWFSDRLYPLVPILGIVPRFPPPIDSLVVWMLVGLLVTVAARPLARLPVAGVVGILAVLFAQDQSRLWPSFYEFFLLFVLALGRRPDGGDAEATRTLAGMRFAVAAVYFWSGVQKLTPHFVREEFPWFLEPLTSLLPLPGAVLPVVAGMAAVAEMLFGIGLLSRRFRRIALVEALLMHAVILVCIGPIRGSWRDSAWIWSLATAALALALFLRAAPFRLTDLFAAPPPWCMPAALVVALLGVLPVLDNVGAWDSALSFNVFTGNVAAGQVIMRPEAAARLPPEIADHAIRHDGWVAVDVDAWSRHEFGAGVYPARRIYRALLATICHELDDASVRLVFVSKATWLTAKETRISSCGDP